MSPAEQPCPHRAETPALLAEAITQARQREILAEIREARSVAHLLGGALRLAQLALVPRPVPTSPPKPGPRIGRGRTLVRGPVVERVVVSTELDPFLPLQALANYAGLSVRKLRDLLVDPLRPLPCYRVGGKVLVRRSDFDAWATAYRQRGREDVDRIVAEVLSDLRR